MGDLIAAARERLSSDTLLTGAVLVALWVGLFGASAEQVASSLLAGALIWAGDVVAGAYDVTEGRWLGVGAAAVVAAAVLAALGDGPLAVPLALGVVGAWVTADAAQTIRHGPPGEESAPPADGTEVYHDYVAGRIQERLADRPHTRLELVEEMAADETAVDAALALLVERGAVERAGGEYRRNTPDEGGLAGRWRSRLARVAGRLARPVTVEFAAGDDRGDGSPPAPTGGQRARDHERDGGPDRDHEPAVEVADDGRGQSRRGG